MEKAMQEPAAPSGEGWSSLWKQEDWLAVWLGFFIMAIVVAGLTLTIPTFRWVTDGELHTYISKEHAGRVTEYTSIATAQGEAALVTELTALQAAIEKKDRAAILSSAEKIRTVAKDVRDEKLKADAGDLGSDIRAQARREVSRVFGWPNIQSLLIIGGIFLVLASVGILLKGGKVPLFLLGFPVVFLLAVASQILGGNHTMREWGFGFVLWSLLLGLLVSNLMKLPAWLDEAVQTEFFIKTGLVIFGASLLFDRIIAAGGLGLIQGIIVIVTVWYVAFWMLKKYFKMDEDFAAVMASAVSICGVSAAIAAHGAVKGDAKKMSYITSLVLLMAVPMMLLQPFIARTFGLSEAVAGAWMAGTIDTTAAVVVAGAMVGPTAMDYAAILKLTQNALIGVVAFVLAVAWCYKEKARDASCVTKPSAMEIWWRFPKFVLGFIVASFVFSFMIDPEVVEETAPLLGHLREYWFAMAFVCIGLGTRYVDLIKIGGGLPALGFVTAQTFNIVWVLIIAYLLFGGVFFPPPF